MTDLDDAAEIGPNLFPNNNRRRIPGVMYLVIGVACLIAWIVRHGHDPVLVDDGYLLAAGLLVVLGGFCLLTGTSLDVDEEQALAITADAVSQPVGHASAEMGWRGWLSRPTWRILWYSAQDPPCCRGFALIDGHDGRVLESFVEENPEDWQRIDGSLDQRI